MILKAFTVYDTKSEAYMQPFFQNAKGQAIRAFEDSCNDPNHPFSKHPGDYVLFEIGAYDDQSGTMIDAINENLGNGIEYKRLTPSQPDQPDLVDAIEELD